MTVIEKARAELQKHPELKFREIGNSITVDVPGRRDPLPRPKS